MKTSRNLVASMRILRIILILSILIFVSVFTLNFCKKDEYNSEQKVKIDNSLKNGTTPNGSILYYGHEIFTRTEGSPVVITKQIINPNFSHFANLFILKICNGSGTNNRVSSAIIKLDGVQIISPSNFSQNIDSLCISIPNITENSFLEVQVMGTPGGFIDLWIEGILKSDHALLTPVGGCFTFLDGQLMLNLPPNAIDNPVYISVKNIFNDLPDQIKSKVNLAYEFLPDGLYFNQPVNIIVSVPENITLEPSSFLGPLDITSGLLQWHNTIVNIEERKLLTSVYHFSKWVNPKFWIFNPNETYTFYRENIPTHYDNSIPSISQELDNDIYRAFKRWETYSQFIDIDFSKASSLETSNIKIKFISAEDANNQYPNDPFLHDRQLSDQSDPVGVTYADLFSDKRIILLRDDKTWYPTIAYSLKNNPSLLNVERVVCHEIGHNFGIIDLIKEFLSEESVMGPDFIQVPIPITNTDLFNLKLRYPNLFINLNISNASNMAPYPLSAALLFNKNKNEILTDAIKVFVSDPNGHPLPNVTVIFKDAIDPVHSLLIFTPRVVLTDANGIATLSSLQVPNQAGTYKLVANAFINPYYAGGIAKSDSELNYTINVNESTLPFSDNFTTGANPAWKIIGGDNYWDFSNGYAVGSYPNIYTTGRLEVGDASWKNYTVEVDAMNTAGTDKSVCFRVIDANNFYSVHLIGPEGGYHRFQLSKIVNGTVSDLMLDDSYTVSLNTNYHIKIIAVGNAIQVYINGILKANVIDNTFSEGGISLIAGSGGYAPNTVVFDNVSVY